MLLKATSENLVLTFLRFIECQLNFLPKLGWSANILWELIQLKSEGK